jgi:hypothetical protein
MPVRILAILFALSALLVAVPAFADCTDDACGAIQKILQARSNNFAKLKGKPGSDPRGDADWEGTQTIPGLINYCYVYKRGENSRYEYRCDAAGMGTQAFLPLEKAKKIAESVRAAFQSVDPKTVWFEDPAARALASIDGFQGTEGWYGGAAKTKLTAKVEIVGSGSGGHTVSVSVFASPLSRRDLK